jgi:hypothetical protein
MLLMPALVLFLIALAIALTNMGLSSVTAHLLSGCIAALGAAVLVFVGIGRLSPELLKPQVTIGQVEKDVEAAKEMVK